VNVKYKVLMIDDSKLVHSLIRARLLMDGLELHSAFGGEEGLAMAAVIHPDIILLDLIMPKIQGFEVLRRLKEDLDTRDIPVVVLSNLGQDGDLQRALAAGAAGYLVKSNLSLANLLTRVTSILREIGEK